MPNQERLRETKHHGAVRFPFNIYPCTIPGDFLQVPLHWHDSMELVYVKKGSGIVQVGVNAYPAEQGDIYIFAPGTLHALHQRGQAVMEYENIIFELELLGGADDLCAERYLLPLQSGRMALQPRIIPGEAGYPQAAACLQETEEANKVKNAGYELAIKGALLRFLSILIGQHGTLLPADTTDTRRLKTVLQLIEAEYATPLRIEDAAEACGCSQSHFMRWFKKMTGQGFTAYLNDHRLNLAAELLRITDATVWHDPAGIPQQIKQQKPNSAARNVHSIRAAGLYILIEMIKWAIEMTKWAIRRESGVAGRGPYRQKKIATKITSSNGSAALLPADS